MRTSNNLKSNIPLSVSIIGGANVDIVGISKNGLISFESNIGKVNVSLGGVARNIAENLGRLKIPVFFYSAIGEDIYGKEILSKFKSLGVDISAVKKIKKFSTSTYLAISEASGELSLAINDMDITKNISPKYIKENLNKINNTAVCIIDCNLPKNTIYYICKNVKVPIFVDTVSASKCEKIKPFLSRVYALKPNVYELEKLTSIQITSKKSFEKAVKKLMKTGLKKCYISRGSKGLAICEGKEINYFPSIKTKVENVTGAGDSLFAGIVFSYVNNFDLHKTATCALSCASITLSSRETVSTELNKNLLVKTMKKHLFKEKPKN